MSGVRFDRKTRVTFLNEEGEKRKGYVTALKHRSRNIKTDDGKLSTVSVRRLREARDEVLMLETRLDTSLRSDRQDREFFRQFFKPYGIRCLYETVHTKKDLAYFLRLARKASSNIRWIHYLGHGDREEGTTRCDLVLTHDRVVLPDQVDIFGDLFGKILIFSCCDVGSNRRVLHEILKATDAQAVFAYRGEVYDEQTRLAEAMLYNLMIRKPGLKPKKVAQFVNYSLWNIGVEFNRRHEMLVVETR